jgi:hypothetical protein
MVFAKLFAEMIMFVEVGQRLSFSQSHLADDGSQIILVHR